MSKDEPICGQNTKIIKKMLINQPYRQKYNRN